ncbi:sugar kinase [Salinibacter sp. 10B]|uniref:ROK family protein n=1 Tax=Salinibacter sp. 10B TaxID=1923971 RepID=UPI000D2BD324|nr:ROK family protein [Salinibacter sp. 10B]PQJ34408.1 sugar kinase [Salinibacter sp. 10B]
MFRIGIDMGGTNIRAAIVEDRAVRVLHQEPTPAEGTEEEVMAQIFALLDRMPTGQAATIGAGVPSVVDVDNGIVYDVQNVPSWTEVPLKARLEERYGVPTVIQNDANCFALAEYHYGSGQGQSPMVGLILGTGFAGGIVVDGTLLSGHNCGAGEFGTAPYKDSIYEHYCAGQFFERQHNTTGKAAFERAQNGDASAQSLFAEMGTHLGRALKSVLYAIDPAHIVLGGSVRHAYSFFEETMWEELESFAYPRALDNLTIEISSLKHAGVLGAAALGLQVEDRG